MNRQNGSTRYLSRRAFLQGAGLTGLGLLAGCTWLPTQAPPVPRVARVGYLSHAAEGRPPQFEALRQGLRDLGYVEGQNLVIETRWADDQYDRLPSLAAELVNLPVDLIVAGAAPAAVAAGQATTTVPIVMATGGDPVRLGLADSPARPGRNVTGLSTLSPALSGKRLELLRETEPSISRVAIMADSANASAADQLRETQAAAQTLGLQTTVLDLHGPQGLAAEFGAATQEGADAVCFLALGPSSLEYDRVVEFTAQNRLPSVFALRDGVDHGGLMAYGPDLVAQAQRSAFYVDRILKGAKPADLPIEQPTRFYFVINLKTAQALGRTIPQHVLLQATEVIQ